MDVTERESSFLGQGARWFVAVGGVFFSGGSSCPAFGGVMAAMLISAGQVGTLERSIRSGRVREKSRKW
jgi:hypothetical protein